MISMTSLEHLALAAKVTEAHISKFGDRPYAIESKLLHEIVGKHYGISVKQTFKFMAACQVVRSILSANTEAQMAMPVPFKEEA